MQPQPGTLAAPLWIHLRKSLKQLRLVLRPDPDTSVGDRELYVTRSIGAQMIVLETDRAALGELDGIVRQIQKNLAQSAAVSHQGQLRTCQLGFKLQIFSLCEG